MDRSQGVRLALVGLSGAGKTTVGRALAEGLGWPFHDLDQRLVTALGRSVAQIFAAEGEAGFRNHETAELVRLTAFPPPLVLAAGGGLVVAPENRRVLKDEYHVIWLRVDPLEASRRLAAASDRPLLSPDDPAGDLRRLLARREGMYREAADTVFDAGDGAPPADVARAILDLLSGGIHKVI